MSPTSTVFYEAACSVRAGWIQRDYSDDNNNQCLVRSILTAIGRPESTLLPEPYVMLLDAHLRRYPDYLLLRQTVGCELRPSLQEIIMAWNDLPWRRRKTVAKALEAIAFKLQYDPDPED